MSSNENGVREKNEFDEHLKRNNEEHGKKSANILVAWFPVCVFLIICVGICVGIFVGTYCLRTKQLDDYVNSLEAADSSSNVTESTEMLALDMIKIGIDGKTYTIPELAGLDEIPTIVDVIIMYEDGSLGSKQAYVSYANDDSITDAEYIDGDYGRLILPKSMRHKE